MTSRACVPTLYAEARGVASNDFYVKGNEAGWGVDPGSTICSWWIRNPGDSNFTAEAIGNVGAVHYYGYPVNLDTIAVRPAMWVTIPGEGQN